jgi:hypothetical protein
MMRQMLRATYETLPVSLIDGDAKLINSPHLELAQQHG